MRPLPVDTQKGILIYGKGIAVNQYVITNLAKESQIWVADTLPNLVNSATGHQADLILFELHKGSKEELRTFKALRLLLREVKILVILDAKSTKEAAKVLKYGATDVFPKPYDPQLLVERVKALLQQD
jgi:DNA-binding response OmpR family regulator